MLSTKVIQNNSLQMLFMAQWGITKEVCPRFPRMRQHDLGQIRGAGRILDCAARQRTTNSVSARFVSATTGE